MGCSRAPQRVQPALLAAALAALLAVAAAAQPQQQPLSHGRALHQDGGVTDAGAALAPSPATTAGGELCSTGPRPEAVALHHMRRSCASALFLRS